MVLTQLHLFQCITSCPCSSKTCTICSSQETLSHPGIKNRYQYPKLKWMEKSIQIMHISVQNNLGIIKFWSLHNSTWTCLFVEGNSLAMYEFEQAVLFSVRQTVQSLAVLQPLSSPLFLSILSQQICRQMRPVMACGKKKKQNLADC